MAKISAAAGATDLNVPAGEPRSAVKEPPSQEAYDDAVSRYGTPEFTDVDAAIVRDYRDESWDGNSSSASKISTEKSDESEPSESPSTAQSTSTRSGKTRRGNSSASSETTSSGSN